VKKGNYGSVLVLHLLGKVKRMVNVRHAAFVGLVFMRLKTKFNGLFGFLSVNHFITSGKLYHFPAFFATNLKAP
jgi:hypothetical protein